MVVIGEIGSREKREILALGETPNIAARLQGLAEPDTLVLSAVTQRLVSGLFECWEPGPQTLKGISTPLAVYQVVGESQAQSRFDVAVRKGLTPLVGREEEVGLLQRRWEQAKTGNGQVVLLSGEPGIGKSRLVQALTEHILTDGAIRLSFAVHPITKTAPSTRSLSICSGSCSLPKTMCRRPSSLNFSKSSPSITSLRPILFRCWLPCFRYRIRTVLHL